MTRKPPKDDLASANSELLRVQLLNDNEVVLAGRENAKLLDKRRHHREKIMRYRHKKKATADEMKTQEQFLAAQLHSMLNLHASQSQTYYSQRHLIGAPAADLQPQQSPTAMDAFVQVLTEKERLHEENTALRHHLDELYKFHESLQKTLNDDAIDDKERQQPEQSGSSQSSKNNQQSHHEDDGHWVQFLPNEAPFYYILLTELECNAYVTKTLESIFTMQSAYLSGGYRGAHAVTLFDWTASLLLEFDEEVQMPMIRYEFRKTFRNSPRTLEELVQGEWNILHSPGLYQSIHRVPVKSKVLQRVNENLSVVMWNAPDPEQSLKYRNVSIFSRNGYQDPEGHECWQISMTGVPLKSIPDKEGSGAENGMPSVPSSSSSPRATTAEGEEVVYVNLGFLYTTFSHGSQAQQQSETGENKNEVHVAFGGHVSILNEEQGRFLMVELGGTCVRLEHLLFPFRVLR